MVLLMLCLHLNSFAQHISMQLKNVTVKQAIETIQKQNGYSFTFAASDLNTQKIITVTARNLPIEKVVEQILIGQNVSYTVQGKDIIIKKKSNQATQQKKKSTISGIITDNYGEPIIGANIKEKNGTNGTISDIDGKFQLTVDEGSSVQISYLGYLTQEVNTRNKTHLAISMKEDAQALDEVVVVGYGTMKKRDLTGAISSIKMDETPVQTFTTVSHALAGKAAGLQVVQTSAQVGGGSSFNIRGAASVGAGNDPLIIIDGFPVSSSSTLGSGNRYEAGQTDNMLYRYLRCKGRTRCDYRYYQTGKRRKSKRQLLSQCLCAKNEKLIQDVERAGLYVSDQPILSRAMAERKRRRHLRGLYDSE